MTRTLTSLSDLVAADLLRAENAPALDEVADRYAVAVSPDMAALIAAGSRGLARQFIPDERERNTSPAERADPIGDAAHTRVPGIVHRHRDRVLLKIVSVCPVYCRFCFRREMVGPGHEANLSRDKLADALAYIRAHAEIWEVILTGGDPLMLSPRRIRALMQALDEIDHVKVVRWHTRVPAVAPDRVTDELATALAETSKAVYLALHANHPDELTAGCRQACARLAAASVRLISQTVLLRGVNDPPETMAALMRGFVEMGVTPYYLHHGDLAPGTRHFRVPIRQGLDLMATLRQRLSGLCQPTYVLDLPGGIAKVPLDSHAVREIAPGVYEIADAHGRVHRYEDDVAL